MARTESTDITRPRRRPDVVGTALPTADEAGTVGGFTGATREEVLARAFENPAPDFLQALREFLSPGLAAVERGLSPDGDPDLPGPLRIAGQALGKSLELTPFPARGRIEAELKGDYKFPSFDDKQGDYFAALPIIGTAGVIARGAQKAAKVAKAGTGVLDDAAKRLAPAVDDARVTKIDARTAEIESDIARILGTAERRTPTTAPVVDDAVVTVERAKGAATPGYGRTADMNVALRAGDPVTDAYRAGFRPEKVAAAAGDDVAAILVRDAEREIAESSGSIAKIAAAAQRRGSIPVAETLSTHTGLTPEQIAKTPAGKAFNAEEMKDVAASMLAAGQRVRNFQKALGEMSDTVQNQGARAEIELRLLAASTEMARLRQVFSGGRAESGRTQNILKYVNQVLAEPTTTAYEQALDAIGGRANAAKFIGALNAIYKNSALTDEEKIRATYSFVAKLGKPSLWDQLGEFFVASILTGIPTHVVNTVSSAGLGLIEVGAKFGAAGFEAALTLGGLRRPREVFFVEAAAKALGILRGSGAAVRASLAYAKSELPATITVGSREIPLTPNKLDLGSGQVQQIQRGAIAGLKGQVIRLPLRALGTEDTFIKTLTVRGGLEEAAAHIAAKERKSFWNGDMGKRIQELLADPTDEMVEFAQKAGTYATLQSDPGKVASTFLRVRQDLPGLRFAIPFITTPANILGRAAEYSPLGFFNVAKGGSAEARALAASRATIGTAFMVPFVNQAMEGKLTGGWPKDAAERNEWVRSGKRPYAIKVGNDWIEFRRFEPISTPLYVMATAYDAYRRGELRGESLDTVALKAVSAMVRSIGDATYFSGLSRLVDAIEDPEASGERFLTNVLTGFVPPAGFLRTAAQAGDPYERNPNGVWEEILSIIPGARNDLTPRRDVYGRPILRPESKQGLLALVNPLVISAEKKDRVDEAVEKSFRTGKFDAQGNPIPAQRLRVGFTSDEIAGFQLGPSESDRLQELAGTETYERIRKLIDGQITYEDKYFDRLSQDEQRKAIEKAVRDSRNTAKGTLADELLKTAESPGETFRAVSMRLETIGARTAKAMYLYSVSQTKQMSLEVMNAIDARKASNDPSFGEFVALGKLILEYRSTPRWLPGLIPSHGEAEVERSLATYKKAKGSMTVAQIKADANVMRLYYELSNGWVSTLYNMDGSRKTKYVHPRRLEIEKAQLFKRYNIDPE